MPFNRFKLPLKNLVLNITAGLIAGLVSVTYSLSFAVLIFSESLASHLSIGISNTLTSATLVAFVVACRSSFKFAIAGPDSNTVAILASMASMIATHLLAQGKTSEVVPTVWAMLVASAILSSIFLLFLSHLKLGHFVRFIPYPVIGGFLAGAGWLIIKGAFTVTSGVRLEFSNLATVFQISSLIRWLPSLAFAVLLKTILIRYNHYLVLPTMLVVGVILTYLFLGAGNFARTSARAGLVVCHVVYG